MKNVEEKNQFNVLPNEKRGADGAGAEVPKPNPNPVDGAVVAVVDATAAGVEVPKPENPGAAPVDAGANENGWLVVAGWEEENVKDDVGGAEACVAGVTERKTQKIFSVFHVYIITGK